MFVQLTERAAQEVKAIMEQQNLPADSTFLRMGVKGGGCSGFSYALDLTEQKNESQDEQWEVQGIQVICDSKSLLYLKGCTVDFKDEITGRGFVFDNPNATGTCGCGSSFSA